MAIYLQTRTAAQVNFFCAKILIVLQQVDFNSAVRKSSFTALGREVSLGVAVLLLVPQQVTWALVLLMCVYHLLRYGSISYLVGNGEL